MKHIKHILLAAILVSLFSCESGIFFPTESGIKKELKGTWKRYTFTDDSDTWEITDEYIVSSFLRPGFTLQKDTSTYSISTNPLKAKITIDTDFNGFELNREWEIAKLKKGLLVLEANDLPQDIEEFEKLD